MTSEGQNGITEKPEEADVLLPHQTPSGDLECNHAEHDIDCVHRTSLKDIPFVTIYAASKFIRLAKRSAASRGIPRPCSTKSLSGSRSTTDSPGHIHSNVPCHRRSTSRSPEKKMKPFFATSPSETASDQRKLLDTSASSGFVVSSQCLGNIASPDRLRCHLSKHLHPSYLSVVDDDRAIGERLSEIDYDIQPPTLKRDIAELGNLILNSYLNIFLIFVPVTIISKYCNWPDTATFVLSCFAMIPLVSTTHACSPTEYSIHVRILRAPLLLILYIYRQVCWQTSLKKSLATRINVLQALSMHHLGMLWKLV